MKEYTPESYYKGGVCGTTYYIYALQNPIDGNIFYVGMTKMDIKSRYIAHISESRIKNDEHKNKDKNSLIQSIIKENKKPILHLIETIECICRIDEIEVPMKEINWMRFFTEMGHNLVNKVGLTKAFEPIGYKSYLNQLKSGNGVPRWYYSCGYDKNGVELFSKQRIIKDGLYWEEEKEEIKVEKAYYNPFNNPIWMKKMGLSF